MSSHIFEEDPEIAGWLPHLLNDAGDVWPEMALVGLALALTGLREGLTGVSCDDRIHAPPPLVSDECEHVVPHWGLVERSNPLSGDDRLLGVRFNLHEALCPVSGFSEHETHVEPAGPGAEGDSA
mgnify:CR=1 FL=1